MYSVKEKSLLIIFAFLGIVSLVFFFNFKTQAFPEYSIDFKVSKEVVKQLSQQKAKDLNIDVNGYTNATIFDINEQSKTYLERNVGVQETGNLAQNDVNIWHFNTRFFKPLQKEEYIFSFSPSGEFVGFKSEIPEDASGTNISQYSALKIAENFLVQNTAINTQDWKIVTSETENKTNRTDHLFIWEKQNYWLKEATLRISVNVYGDQVGSFNQFLKVPDQWIRAYDQERSYNTLAQTIAEGINYTFFGLAIIAFFIIQFRHHQLNLNFAKKVAVVIAVISFLVSINNFPIFLYYFPTTQTFSAFITEIFFASASSAFFSGLLTFLVVTSGESIYRQTYQDKINLAKIFPWGIFSKGINISLFIGVFTGFIFLAYVVVFYFLGQKLGFWVPAEINYSDIFNTYIPWIYPLLIGLSAAVLEEGIFRLFGITFLNKYLKNTFLAVAITSIAWAFLHSSYPQSPWYARGVEITFVGFVLGWLYLRFGIMASITAHYTFNALQTAIFFLSANNLYITVTSFITALIPLILALAGLIYVYKKREFISIEKLLNQVVKTPKLKVNVSSLKQKFPQYVPLKKSYIFMMLGAAILFTFVAGIIVSLNNYQSFNNFNQYVTREKVSNQAEKIVKNDNIDINDYYYTAFYSSTTIDPLIEKYFVENLSAKNLEEIYPKQIPLEFWHARFFKPLEKQEYVVRLLSDGTLYSLDYVLDENTIGAKLSLDQATSIAQNYLQTKNINDKSFKLVDQQIQQHPNRTDYFFIFEKQDKYKDATIRIDLDILGDKPSGYFEYIKLPEDWVRQNSETNLVDIVVQVLLSIFFGVTVVLTVITFLKLFRKHQLNFKQTRIIAALLTIVLLLSSLNGSPSFYASFDTSIPLQNFIIQNLIEIGLSILFGGLVIWATITLFKNLWETTIAPVIPVNNLKNYLKDAVIISYLSLFLIIPVVLIFEYIFSKFNLISVSQFSLNLGFDTYLPVINEFNQTIFALFAFILGTTFILVLLQYTKSWIKLLIILILVMGISATLDVNNINSFLKNFLPIILSFIIAIVFSILLFRKNLFAYLGFIYVSVLISSGGSLLMTQSIFYKLNGIVLLILSVLPIVVFLIYRLKYK